MTGKTSLTQRQANCRITSLFSDPMTGDSQLCCGLTGLCRLRKELKSIGILEEMLGHKSAVASRRLQPGLPAEAGQIRKETRDSLMAPSGTLS